MTAILWTAIASVVAIVGSIVAIFLPLIRSQTASIETIRSDLKDLRTELKSDIGDLRTELKSDIGDLRTELKSDIGDLRTELKSDIGDLRSDVRVIHSQIYDLNGKLNRVVGHIESVDSPSVGQLH